MQFLKLSTDLITDTNITPSEFRIYAYLLSLYNAEKQCSYPSIDVIADKLDMSVSTVKRSIKRLAELGYIVIEKRKGLAGNFNIYKKLKHLISNAVAAKKKAPSKVGVDSDGNEPIDGQVCLEDILNKCEDEEETTAEINALDNHTNVRLGRAVTNVDNSGFAKKVLSLANTDLVRQAIREFKKKKGENSNIFNKVISRSIL